MNELNQKIHEWLGRGCYHRTKWRDLTTHPCDDCGHQCTPNEARALPDYTTDPAAMLELIEAVREKGISLDLHSSGTSHHEPYNATIRNGKYYAFGDTLPMAVALAVSKLIEATHVEDGRGIQEQEAV